MSPLEALAIFGAGVAAGTINTIVGSGSLITFPTLLAFGYPALDANVSNTVGLVPGSLSGAFGYRRELAGQGQRALWLGAASGAGGLTGAILLLAYPGAFKAIVPVLIAVALVLVAIGPRLARLLAERRHAQAHRSGAMAILFFATAVYGGYFGAGMGIIMISLLTIFLSEDIQRLNGLKNVLAALINGVAGVLFILIAPIRWMVVVLIAAGSILGGQLGAGLGRRLSPTVLRLTIIVVGLVAEARLLLT